MNNLSIEIRRIDQNNIIATIFLSEQLTLTPTFTALFFFICKTHLNFLLKLKKDVTSYYFYPYIENRERIINMC